MSSAPDNIEQKLPEITGKHKLFCEEYVVDLNATQAYIRAGYSEKGARQAAHKLLTNADIKAYISELLIKKQMTGDEAVKLIGDIAKSSLNDYFIIKTVEHTPRISKPLQQIIDELQGEIDFEWEYGLLAEFNEKEQSNHDAQQTERKRRLLRYKLELKQNPKATRIVNGETVFVKEAVLDLVRLVQDKEAGRIKSYKVTKDGPHVELYAADAALLSVAKITGKVTEKIDHTTGGKPLPRNPPLTFISSDQLTQEQIDKLIEQNERVNSDDPGT